MSKRVLITGATGMLGATLVKHFQNTYSVFATGTAENAPDFIKNYRAFNLIDSSYKTLIDWAKPEVVIHCAALTNGNYCDKNPQEAMAINGVSLHKICEAVSEKTHIIYISTDAVFSNETHFASEETCVNPQSTYGKSKELGEFFLKKSGCSFTILRTTIVGLNLNEGRQGFVEWIINSAKNKDKISLFDDVLFTPISIWNMAEKIHYIIENEPLFSSKTSHLTGTESCTKYEFGMALLEKFQLPTKNIKQGKITDFADRAKRSTDQTLDCSKFTAMASVVLPTFEETINEIYTNYNERT